MTIDHTGHAASGCPQFDLAHPPRVASAMPCQIVTPVVKWKNAHIANQSGCMGIDVTCVECLKTGRLLSGDWYFKPGNDGAKVYCRTCWNAEAAE
jgi:hypothetical protein